MKNPSHRAEWSAPQIFKVDNETELLELQRDTDSQHIIDTVDTVADDLFELHHPKLISDEAARAEYTADIMSQGLAFGRWVHYPWADSLVRVPEPDDLYNVRTFRNRNLVTKEDQTIMRMARVAVFGLSVGSNFVDRAVQLGIGNHYDLFDYDRLSLANLNRIQAALSDLGLRKTTIAGRKVAELDPYITQRHFTDGYNRETDDILRANRPDIIVEEVDSLEVKARIRNIAKELGIPLVMAGDVGYRSTFDVERHDTEDVAPFNDKLSEDDVQAILAGSNDLNILIKMLGKENISQTLLESVMLKGVELAGTPQLGPVAAIGGAKAAIAAAEILSGHAIKSGAHVLDVKHAVGSQHPDVFPLDVRE